MTRDEEIQLIRTIAQGDKDQYRIVVNEFKGRIYNMILRQVTDEAIADELAQEVFVKGFLGIKNFRGESSLSTWLTRIALNETNNFFNSKRFKQQKRHETFDTEKHGGSYEGSPEAVEMNKSKIHLQLQEALGKMKSPYRETLTLCGFEQKSYEEAAEILQVPVGTIRSRLNKARLLLKELLSSCEVLHE